MPPSNAPCWAFLAEYAVDLIDERVGHAEVVDARVREAHGVEGLLVLPKSNATDKALIVEIEPLASHRDDGLRQPRVLDLKPVDLEVLRIRNDGVGEVPIHGVVEVVVELDDTLDFDEPLQVP